MLEFRPPRKNPKFRLKTKSKENMICICHKEKTERELLIYYALAYKKSARIIVDSIYEKKPPNISELDFYFFPIAYLYRHSLELMLKAIGFKFFLNEDKKREILSISHNLVEILEKVEVFIKEINSEDRIWLKAFLSSINEIDQASDAFRYPFKINVVEDFTIKKVYSRKTVVETQTHVNLIAFVNKMEKAFAILKDAFEKNNFEMYGYDYSAVFLEEGGTYYEQSVIGYSYHKNRFYPYVAAYSECAAILFSKYDEDKNLKSLIFFPMCYLFRNSLELLMKQLLFEECRLDFQKSAGIAMCCKHNLISLWEEIVPEVKMHTSDDHIKRIAEYIEQYSSFDNDGNKLRYPVQRNMKKYFKQKNKFDIKISYEFFIEIFTLLDGLNAIVSHNNEVEDDYRNQY